MLAGGLGTRIRPVLGDTPKLLAPIAGRPYLSYLLDWLREFGAYRVVLGLGFGADKVLDLLRSQPCPDLELCPLVEPSPLGTAGAVRFARAELRSNPVLVMNGDSFVSADLCEFVERHSHSAARGTILCVEVDDAARYGRVLVDDRGFIESFREKDPAFHGPALVNGGVYLLSAALLDELAAGDARSLESDVFQRMPPGSLAVHAGRFSFIDIGTPESLARSAEVFGATRTAGHLSDSRP